MKKGGRSYYRPTGRLDPDSRELAQARLALANLQEHAQRGQIILLYEDATILGRLALPRAGRWRTAHRSRLTTGRLSRTQLNQHDPLKRQTWPQYRSWSRLHSGVLLSGMGAGQYGTHKVFWKVVPHFDSYEFRQFIHQLRHTFGKDPQSPPVVMAGDRSGIPRATALQTT